MNTQTFMFNAYGHIFRGLIITMLSEFYY